MKAKSVLTESEIEAILTKKGDIRSQISALTELLELTESDVEERISICEHVQRTFSIRFRDVYCSVHAFGSSVNGLGFRGCDLDAYVELDLPPFNGEDIKSLQERKVLMTAQVLRELPGIVAGIVAITNARVPIVKFVHRTTAISCDLSFKNRMSVLNTEFIGRSMQWATWMRPFIMCLR